MLIRIGRNAERNMSVCVSHTDGRRGAWTLKLRAFNGAEVLEKCNFNKIRLEPNM
jgi:hypothetical protein